MLHAHAFCYVITLFKFDQLQFPCNWAFNFMRKFLIANSLAVHCNHNLHQNFIMLTFLLHTPEYRRCSLVSGSIPSFHYPGESHSDTYCMNAYVATHMKYFVNKIFAMMKFTNTMKIYTMAHKEGVSIRLNNNTCINKALVKTLHVLQLTAL